MADMFGRSNQVLAGGLTSDSMFMSWPELPGNGLGLLIQQVGMDYRQPVRRIFELGPGLIAGALDANGNLVDAGFCDLGNIALGAAALCIARTQTTYYIVGRPEGRLQLQRYVGPKLIGCDFYRRYGNPCTGGNVVQITGRAGCNSNAATSPLMAWNMNGVVIDGYRGDASGQEMVMQEGVSAMFVGLNITADGLDCTTTDLVGAL